jgi:ribosome biogenesis protein ENP2
VRQLTSIAFDESGMCLATGTSTGCVAVYDIRSARPLQTKRHQYEVPIKALRFHRGPASGITSATSQLLASADEKILKIWFKDSVSAG